MKIRDIKPGQFFILPRTGNVWLKMVSKNYGMTADKQIAMVVRWTGSEKELFSIGVWTNDYDGDEYEIIPAEDV